MRLKESIFQIQATFGILSSINAKYLELKDQLNLLIPFFGFIDSKSTKSSLSLIGGETMVSD